MTRLSAAVQKDDGRGSGVTPYVADELDTSPGKTPREPRFPTDNCIRFNQEEPLSAADDEPWNLLPCSAILRNSCGATNRPPYLAASAAAHATKVGSSVCR